jgi:hypothetical protein
MPSRAALATIAGFAGWQSLIATETSELLEGDTERERDENYSAREALKELHDELAKLGVVLALACD